TGEGFPRIGSRRSAYAAIAYWLFWLPVMKYLAEFTWSLRNPRHATFASISTSKPVRPLKRVFLITRMNFSKNSYSQHRHHRTFKMSEGRKGFKFFPDRRI